jgi:PAS domain S-box-containing protein
MSLQERMLPLISASSVPPEAPSEVSRIRLQEWTARWGWVLALAALVVLLSTTYYLDLQNRMALEAAQRDAASAADREASTLAEALATEVAQRVGALTAAKLQFTQEVLSEEQLMAAVDSVIVGLPGLAAVNVISPDSLLTRSRAALLGRMWSQPLTIPEVGEAYDRAVQTGRPAATPVLELLGQRRFVVFDPVMGTDTAGLPELQAVLAAELEPLALLRSALAQERPGAGPAFYDIYDPAGTRVTTVPAPTGWPQVVRPIAVADTEWSLAVAHQPVAEQPFHVVSAAIRISGLLLALAFAVALLFLWRTVRSQQTEIGRRLSAEARARESAAEAARRAAESRSLSEQLASAQDIALRLSSALDPDRVIDDFLGAVGEVLEADTALLYEFDETGDAVVGRRRLILDPDHPEKGQREDDFRKVRVPISLMPHLAETVGTGEPYLAAGEALEGSAGATAGVARPVALLTVPLTIAGHLVGLAVWDTYSEDRGFHPDRIPFARAVSAQAAAILRAAELLEGVRLAQQRAAGEARRLATVLDQLADGVVLFDEHGQPERVNPAAEALLGEELRAVPFEAWPAAFGIRQVGRGQADEFLLLRAARGERVEGLRLTARHGGAEKYLAASSAPIRGRSDRVRGVAVVVRDVTAEHEYAEMLRHTNQELRQQASLLERANDELRAATTAKDQFLAMMSHELRTPINAIIGYSDLLDIGVHGGLNDRQRAMVTRIVETSRHLLGLINDVLDLTKIGAGRLDMHIDVVPLMPVVERALNQISPLAESKDLVVAVRGNGRTRVLADETRLSQILINLASNAVKFTEHGGVELEYAEDDGRVRILVRDTGPGIPEDELERVFDEFHQVEAGHSRSAGGTGLGLAISRRLARLMGGDLTVDSELGVGSVFAIDLPAAPGGAALSDDPAGPEGALRMSGPHEPVTPPG